MITNASLIATGNFEIVGAAIECTNCSGSGLVADTQPLSIGRGIKVVNRRCRPCGGSGEIFPLEAIPSHLKDQEIGAIPAWMTS